MPGDPKQGAKRPPIVAMLISAIVGLVLGYIVLRIVNAGITLVWETVPEIWGEAPIWYVVGVLLISAVLVYFVRRYVGDTGHPPLGGITVSPLTPREYLAAILAILASLFGGAVLGPEVALVATGSVIGTIVAGRTRLADATDAKKIVAAGAGGAILALIIGPLLNGSMTVSGAPQSIEVDQLAWAIAVAIVATGAITLARLLAALVARMAGAAPHLGVLVGAALVVAAAALITRSLTGESVLYVVTSGEELITQLTTITSTSAVIAIVVFKSLAYAVSMGSGFRGGPFFPAMFVGAAAGLLVALVAPSGPSVQAAIVVGVVASVVATARMSWLVAIALGVVIGFLIGTWTLVPAAALGAAVARAIPRLGERVSAPDVATSSQQDRPA